jgi:hypothetical protein
MMIGMASPVREHSVDPAKAREVIDRHTAFMPRRFDVARAQAIAEIPADVAEDDVSLKVVPLEQCKIAHG